MVKIIMEGEFLKNVRDSAALEIERYPFPGNVQGERGITESNHELVAPLDETGTVYQSSVRHSYIEPIPIMQLICPGCGLAFKCSRISHHVCQSKNPHCRLPDISRQPEDQDNNPGTMSVSGSAMTNRDENEPGDRLRPSVDPLGDLFGDYADYEGLDLGEDNEGDQVIDHDTEGEGPEVPLDPQEEEEEEEEAELHKAILAEEDRLELEQPGGLPGDSIEQEAGDAPSEEAQAPFRSRGGFERPLSNRPQVVEFSNRNAGTVYGRAHQNANQDYHRAVSNTGSPNIYAPFSSRLDWEVVRWAKMRGPGSNAVTELLSIEGVRFLPIDSEF